VHDVRGRKSDVQDCQWLQELYSVGLLQASFRAAGEIVALRGYVRHRQTLVEGAAGCIHRMQKALTEMNLKLHHVPSELTGVTGMAIVRDILAGVRDPHLLAAHRDGRCKPSEAEIAAALTGQHRPEHLFMLRQNFEALSSIIGKSPSATKPSRPSDRRHRALRRTATNRGSRHRHEPLAHGEALYRLADAGAQ
jgi:hypothetical protein